MLRRSCFACALLVSAASASLAQEPTPAVAPRAASAPENQIGISGLVTPTPEMWLYEQELRRYEDPQVAIRHRAELKGSQRRTRLAAMKWYGKSNSRPTVSPVPTCDGYSAYWGSNTFNPMRWQPTGGTVQVVNRYEAP